uniref:Uncharacterized protein n=1 Tax=Rhizophora mucronata TaxID=61149 RepID=A0A2P2PA29_RHIMU
MLGMGVKLRKLELKMVLLERVR